MKKLLYKIDKHIRPKKRFFDDLLDAHKFEPHKKQILSYIKKNKSIRGLSKADKYNYIADFFLEQCKTNIDPQLIRYSKEFRVKAVIERMRNKKYLDAFSLAKKYTVLESFIITDALLEMDKFVELNETKINKTKDVPKQRGLFKETILTLSFISDYARHNNFASISNSLKQKINELEEKYVHLKWDYMKCNDKAVRTYYNTYNYPVINLYTNRQRKHHLKLISDILSYGKLSLANLSGKRVLDAGCGSGEKSVMFSKYGAKVTGIDFSSSQISQARGLANKSNQNIKFIEKDLVIDNLTDLGTFDVIVCTGVLHHTKNPKLAFQKLSNQLNKDGIIIIGLYHKYSRLRYRLIRFFIRTFISRSYDSRKIINWLDNSWLARTITHAPRNSLHDRYVVPHESYHTLRETKKWFRKNNINLISSSSNVKGIELFKIFEKKSIFFVGGKKIWLNQIKKDKLQKH